MSDENFINIDNTAGLMDAVLQNAESASEELAEVAPEPVAEEAPAEETAEVAEAASDDELEVQEVADEAAEEPKEEAGPEPFVLKVDGQEIEVESRDEITRLAQMGLASQSRFAEAAQLKKELQETVRYIKENPAQALEDLGVDMQDVSYKYLEEYLRVQTMDSDQKQLWEKNRDLERKFREKNKHLEVEEERKVAEATPEAQAQFDRELSDAIDAAGIAKTPAYVKRVIQKVIEGYDSDYERSCAQAVDLANHDLRSELASFLSKQKPESVVKFFGEDVLKLIRQADIDRVKKKAAPPVKAKDVAKPKEPRKSKSAFVDPSEWLKQMEDAVR